MTSRRSRLELVEQALASASVVPSLHGDQLVARGHDVADGNVVAGLEAQVTPGDDAHYLAPFTHREAGDAQLLGQIDHLAHGVGGCDDDRVAQHA
jgi:hypothetical protein